MRKRPRVADAYAASSSTAEARVIVARARICNSRSICKRQRNLNRRKRAERMFLRKFPFELCVLREIRANLHAGVNTRE